MLPETNSVFRLSGEQTVRTIAETHHALVEFYNGAASITIDPAPLTDADLTLIQLIQALRNTAARDGKKICMTGPLPDVLRDVLVRGGFLNNPDANLFWAAP